MIDSIVTKSRSMLFICVLALLYVPLFIINKRDSKQEVIKEPSMKKISSSNLFENNEKPSPPLKKLLHILGLEQVNTLEKIVEVTQKNLLRMVGKERWEVSDEHYKPLEKQIMPLLKELGLVDIVYPTQNYYDYALWMGSLLTSAQKRILFLKQLWQQGVRFNKLVILTGERALLPEERDEISADVKNEPEMMRWVYENTQLPEDMRKVPVVYIASKAALGARRATTPDTVIDWIKTNPKPGSALVISSQPYVFYQSATVKTYIPKNFTIDSCGEAASKDTPITTYLDSLARWIYQENRIITKERCFYDYYG